MKVYVVECGVYAEMYIEGVYDTASAAIAANPPRVEGRHGDPQRGHVGRPGGWQQESEGQWWNGLDMGDAASITAYEVQS